MKVPDVPASMHEAMIERHFANDPTTGTSVPDNHLQALKDAMQSARLNAERARDLTLAVMKNKMMTVPARHREAKEKSWKVTEAATLKLDAARRAAEAEVKAVTARINAPPKPTDTTGAGIAAEVRGRLAQMSPDGRRQALQTALSAGDDVVLGAALHGPALLSGMTDPTELNEWRMRWQLARHPGEVDRIARLGKALVDIERAGSLLVAFTGSLTDSSIIAAAEASEREAAEATAAVDALASAPY